MDINLQIKKNELIQWLTALEDEFVIDQLMNLRKKENADFWNESSIIEQKSIEKGIKDANDGKLTSHSTVKKKYEKWL